MAYDQEVWSWIYRSPIILITSTDEKNCNLICSGGDLIQTVEKKSHHEWEIVWISLCISERKTLFHSSIGVNWFADKGNAIVTKHNNEMKYQLN